jgi:dCTP deaminase
MILTGSEIVKMVKDGSIKIELFSAEQVNPNSYNYRLGPKLLVARCENDSVTGFDEIALPEDGYVLRPHTMYLGHTHETLGSDAYAMSLIGRSSLGRLGLFLQVSANLGHTGSSHQWTLEIVAAKPFKVYPYMRIGQISFWCNMGTAQKYNAGYSRHNDPEQSRLMTEPTRPGRDNPLPLSLTP